MRSSLEHLPENKQRELARVVAIIHEEFADALSGTSAAFKKRGRILKIILFGSYARGTWVDEPHTMKGYRSDYDILVIVNSKQLADPQYWDKGDRPADVGKGCEDAGRADRPRCQGGE
ncbi:putative nucleotidyltransferase [Rhizobium mongolense]